MPTTPRKRTAAATEPERAPATETAPRPSRPAATAGAPPVAPATAGHDRGGLADLITFPARVSQELAHDVAVTARNPEAVAYWGGLAALAVVGALEWPVAVAAGLGVVVAGAVRRGRS